MRNNKCSKKNIIFCAQRYPIPEREYISTILDILYKYAKEYKTKVFIKLHPKERIETIDVYKELSKDKQGLIIMENISFPAEDFISQLKPRKVLSIASTSLVYTTLISKDIKAISIYPLFRKEVLKKIEYKEEYFKDIESHYSLLSKFDGIRILNNTNEI
ncbi:polysialyltransferase family glycosyltransferase [Mannheimia haemolytica]|uniref:polysialyltransferase family glycosyltransferase n=1 Tax=Mannheimia haemolytica TaxID=75985 RepID=UPI0031F57358